MTEIRTIRDTHGIWRWEQRSTTGQLLYSRYGFATEGEAEADARRTVTGPFSLVSGRR